MGCGNRLGRKSGERGDQEEKLKTRVGGDWSEGQGSHGFGEFTQFTAKRLISGKLGNLFNVVLVSIFLIYSIALFFSRIACPCFPCFQ